jgi:HPt (histidine-containing phosphotransfer) domain-containing protein
MAYTDLNYLKNITEGNKEIVREMIEMFILQVPEFITNLNRFYQTGQYAALGKEAHKAKSSLQIMGMTELELEMKRFQLKTIEEIEVESYPVHIRNFENQCKAAIEELKAELNLL